MKRNELVNELNNALFDVNGNGDIDYIQTTLTCEQWEELAPYLNYKFKKLFEAMPDDEWEKNEELQYLAGLMVEAARYDITGVLIDPDDDCCANVIYYSGRDDEKHDWKELYYVVNV